jgi:hypothetical protein
MHCPWGYRPGSKSFLVPFSKKELLSLFFSEEKNQKTFVPARVMRYGNWPDGGAAERVNDFDPTFWLI